MFSFSELPKEMKENEFGEFLNKVNVDFPADKFPEIFVQYYKTGGKVIVLGIGKSADCAEQTTHSVEKMPSLKGKQLQLKFLRIPKTGLLLR